ncbi:MAG: cystathionine gamma-lyase [Olpidium bornovanus]|uniref:cystathionine gamma-lyase n=1 Tax=Olpidium bornovanus TaxID=278681 RepID=A0A8H7ZPT6_9FUNG|nr:MAG: cystathionine gamma-lyase [Olpidium bornovanus]
MSLSTTFKQASVGQPIGKFDYSRSGNPTRQAFEAAVAALEGAKHGLAFSSGSATSATITNMFPTGSHFITVNDVYGGTYRFFTRVAKHQGIDVDFIDMADPETIFQHFKPNTKLVWIETPTNPTLRLVDIQKVASLAHQHGAILVVDNTFMSPFFQRPLDHGADMVVHSVTKYINGHSDVVMGVAVTNDQSLFERLTFLQNSIGAVPSAFDCFLANRGLKTLHLRMHQHQMNAFAVARYLESQLGKTVHSVIYPGLESHPQHNRGCCCCVCARAGILRELGTQRQGRVR